MNLFLEEINPRLCKLKKMYLKRSVSFELDMVIENKANTTLASKNDELTRKLTRTLC